MATIFTRIIQGEIPAYKVAEDDKYYAFLDINPLSIGHTLVVPKAAVDYIFDLDDEIYSGLWQFAKKVGKAVENVVSCKRIGLVVLGIEIPHAHIHIIPLNSESDIDFKKPRVELSSEAFISLAEKINLAYLEL